MPKYRSQTTQQAGLAVHVTCTCGQTACDSLFAMSRSSTIASLAAAANLAGTIPAELEGTLLRNGPGLLEIGGRPLSQPLDGDGMVRIYKCPPSLYLAQLCVDS